MVSSWSCLQGHLAAVFVHGAHQQGQQIVVLVADFLPSGALR